MRAHERQLHGSTTIVCTLDEALDVGEEWNLTIQVTADDAQTLNNVADVELALPGVDPGSRTTTPR